MREIEVRTMEACRCGCQRALQWPLALCLNLLQQRMHMQERYNRLHLDPLQMKAPNSVHLNRVTVTSGQ
jgi:hypothetical protein